MIAVFHSNYAFQQFEPKCLLVMGTQQSRYPNITWHNDQRQKHGTNSTKQMKVLTTHGRPWHGQHTLFGISSHRRLRVLGITKTQN